MMKIWLKIVMWWMKKMRSLVKLVSKCYAMELCLEVADVGLEIEVIAKGRKKQEDKDYSEFIAMLLDLSSSSSGAGEDEADDEEESDGDKDDGDGDESDESDE